MGDEGSSCSVCDPETSNHSGAQTPFEALREAQLLFEEIGDGESLEVCDEAGLFFAMAHDLHHQYWESAYRHERLQVMLSVPAEQIGERLGCSKVWYGMENALRALLMLENCDRMKPALDVGCGNGHFCALLHRTGFQAVIGLDYSEEAVMVAKRLKSDYLVLLGAPEEQAGQGEQVIEGAEAEATARDDTEAQVDGNEALPEQRGMLSDAPNAEDSAAEEVDQEEEEEEQEQDDIHEPGIHFRCGDVLDAPFAPEATPSLPLPLPLPLPIFYLFLILPLPLDRQE